MREIDELYADSGEPVEESHGVSRGTALKVGGIGLAGALAAFMPGGVGAAVRRYTSNASCTGNGFVCIGKNVAYQCGSDSHSVDGTCFCGTVYYGKIRPAHAPVGACVENSFCATAPECSGGNRDCPSGTVCTTSTCCQTIFGYEPICLPYCQQFISAAAKPLNTPKTAAHR